MRTLAFVTLLIAWPASADELLSLRVTQQAAERHGRAAISIVVLPAAGMRLLDDGPLTLELTGDTPRSLRRQDAVDPRAETPRFEVPLGKTETSLHAHLLAWVCKAQRCRPVELTQDVPVR